MVYWTVDVCRPFGRLTGKITPEGFGNTVTLPGIVF
jgi:hypothetical protein